MIQKLDPETDPQGRGVDMSMQHVLDSCYDFATEKTAFQWIMLEKGHIPEMSPKCHPEVAGVGIEYTHGGRQSNISGVTLTMSASTFMLTSSRAQAKTFFHYTELGSMQESHVPIVVHMKETVKWIMKTSKSM